MTQRFTGKGPHSLRKGRAMGGIKGHDNEVLDLYFQDVSCSEPLRAEEEVSLARRIRAGDQEARNRLVSANLRFVIKIACGYRAGGVALEDMISAGNMGLISAAERFDETRGFKFITYAVWWVRQAINQTLSQDSRMVRLPANRLKLLHNIMAASRTLGQVHASEPEPEMIAEKLGVSVEMVEDTLVKSRDVCYIDSLLCDDEDQDLLKVIPDESQESPDTRILEDSDREQVEQVLRTLDDREAQILRMHFGLGDVDPMTLEQIGSRFKLTKERVRQIKEKALTKLRHPRRREQLDPLMDRA